MKDFLKGWSFLFGPLFIVASIFAFLVYCEQRERTDCERRGGLWKKIGYSRSVIYGCVDAEGRLR
jgi:hypothetical protein